ncbi:hypothetical protein Syun_028015 [Stephania yunnanensis]|uniref:Uncharacterized protein n=1 Tax=Stephania yunnanensis TaxID=152371 RepID=A0AAP0HNC4_9MAGN
MIRMVHEAVDFPSVESNNENIHNSCPNEETRKFQKILLDAEQPLYPECNEFTTLSFIVRLLNLKVLGGWSGKSFTMLLELLNDAFPIITKLPKTFYEAYKLIKDLGFTCETWDACPNNCILFKDKDKDLDSCIVCHASRYKELNGKVGLENNRGEKESAKRMRYFPLKSRLKR